MSNFARIINNVAIDVSPDPDNHFHRDLAKEFVIVPDNVQPGWTFSTDTGWVAPVVVEVPAAPVVVESIKVSPVQFKLLFTSTERVAIRAARTSDPEIEDFFSIIEDPRLTEVDLGLSSTIEALDYLVLHNVITEARKAEILTGKLK
jgi:hypothetical protein